MDIRIMKVVMMLFDDPFGSNSFGFWMFQSIAAVVLFAVFIPFMSWIGSRRKEREAYYRAETLRRLSESQTEGAKATLELLWEENRQKRLQAREGLKVGGLINVAVGIALVPFLRALTGANGVALCGLIPMFIGVAMLVYVYALAEPLVDRRDQ